MKAYFLLLFGMLWSDLGSIKSGFFFNTQANRKNTGKKPYPPITMPLAMLVTALQLHFQSCWRLSTVIPYHSIQRSSNLIEIFLSLWWSSTPTFYVLLENEHFGSLTSLSRPRIPFFRSKRGGGSAYSTAAWFVAFLVMKIDNSLHILQGSFIKTEALRVILIKGRWTSVQSNGDSIVSNLCRWLWLWFNVLPLRLANTRSKTRKYN